MTVAKDAQKGMEWLTQNPYPGRGIVVGWNPEGHIVQIYWLMGRSDNSRNRVLREETGRIYTKFADSSKGGNPELVIYNAMRDNGRHFAVSNGHQTDPVFENVNAAGKEDLFDLLKGWEAEPDAPNFTPRITGLTCSPFLNELAIIRRYSDGVSKTDYYPYRLHRRTEPVGYGRCITTYAGDGNPLPSFDCAPLRVPIEGDTAQEIAERFWSVLNEENRVSLVVKRVRPSWRRDIHIINRHSEV